MRLTRPASSFLSKIGASFATPACSEPLARSREMVLRRRWFMMLMSISANSGFWWSACWNCFSSRPMTVHWLFARAVAVRAACAITAISPKVSPGLTVPITLFCAIMSISPRISTYIFGLLNKPPFSSSAKRVAPASKLSGLPAVLKNSMAIAAL